MKQILTILLACISLGVFANDVKINKEDCTITKDGNTYPLYGEVKFVDTYGSADIVVKVVENGWSDLLVKKQENGSPSYCGEWRIIENGSADLNVKIVTSGWADITVKFIDEGSSGLR